MEFRLSEHRHRVVIEWNGPVEPLGRKLISSHVSRLVNLKVYFYYPRMPTNHTICLFSRMKKIWLDKVGQDYLAARKILDAAEKMPNENKLFYDDETLISFLEDLSLDDVGADLDLIGVRKRVKGLRTYVECYFGFSPDDVEHFISNMIIRNDTLCYGRNGDIDLV